MASPSLPDPHRGLRCGRPTCPCRLPDAAVHCPVCRGLRPSLDVAWRDGAWALVCHNRCGSGAIADAVRRLGLWPATAGHVDIYAPLRVRRLDAVAPRPLAWLWPGFVPTDALTLLIGAPGVGTSWLAIDLAARVTNGAPAPGGIGRFPQGPVLIVTPYSPESFLLPRLDAQGADPAQVYVVDSIDLAPSRSRSVRSDPLSPLRGEGQGEGDRDLRVQRDASHLQSVLADTGARLLIVDPIDAFALGPLAQRRLLTALARIAVRASTAVLALAHQPHLDLSAALGRAYATPTIARSVLLVGEHPRDDDYRFVVTIKAPDEYASFGRLFRILPRSARSPVPQLRWGEDTAVGDLLHDPWPPAGPDQAVDEASGLLQRMLRDGPRPAREVKQAASDAGIPHRALYEARGELGVLTTRVNAAGPGSRGRGAWHWYLRSHALSTVEGEGFDWERSVTLSEAKGLVPVPGCSSSAELRDSSPVGSE